MTFMTRNEALIQAIEFDLSHYHRQRMSQRAGIQMQLLRNESMQLAPDPERLRAIREAMVETTRDQTRTALTVSEVIEPLRRGVSIDCINQADRIMADPAAWPGRNPMAVNCD